MVTGEREPIREDDDQAPPCPTCGCTMEWRECEGFGCDDGMVNVYEEDVINNDPDDEEPCQICEGAGGWWACPNTPAWCAANPAGEEG